MISSEAVPFSKSGGLADVVGALTPVLKKGGNDARIFVPAYNTLPENAGDSVCSFSVPMLGREEKVEIRAKKEKGTTYLFLCHPYFCERTGIYGNTSFEPYPDNFERFSLFCKAAILMCKELNWKPDIFHCHDWTAGLLPYFLKSAGPFFTDSKTVFTIHNLAYQGTFSRMDWLLCAERPDEKCFWDGRVNMLRTGLVFSDYITTVSPTYAKEIQTTVHGCGMEDILVKRRKYLKGIVNGIDIKDWSPTRDVLIPYHFSMSNLKGKAKLKAEIQKEFNLPVAPDVPMFAMISRLASQKGFDALLPVLENLVKEERLQFIIIGTGDSFLEKSLLEMASRNDNLSVNIMFSNRAAHLVEAGSDFFLMPSRYEPCGLNQLYSLRYGTIPIARRTGGLADTIVDVDEHPQEGTGLLFDDLTPEEISRNVKRAVSLYNREGFDRIIKRAMDQDFSWETSAEEYMTVYKKLQKKHRGSKR